jgi:hypothetical protein
MHAVAFARFHDLDFRYHLLRVRWSPRFRDDTGTILGELCNFSRHLRRDLRPHSPLASPCPVQLGRRHEWSEKRSCSRIWERSCREFRKHLAAATELFSSPPMPLFSASPNSPRFAQVRSEQRGKHRKVRRKFLANALAGTETTQLTVTRTPVAWGTVMEHLPCLSESFLVAVVMYASRLSSPGACNVSVCTTPLAS